MMKIYIIYFIYYVICNMGKNLVYGIIVCVIYVDVELDKRLLGVYMCEFIL